MQYTTYKIGDKISIPFKKCVITSVKEHFTVEIVVKDRIHNFKKCNKSFKKVGNMIYKVDLIIVTRCIKM
jgi:hypothetical protein